MLLNVLVKTINSVIRDIEPEDIKITTGCLLYSYLNNQTDKLDLRSKALSFKEYYYLQCVDKKVTNRTIGFVNIENLIKNKKITTLSDISTTDYETILKSFNSTELEESFDPKDVNPRTYGKLSFKSNGEKAKFTKLHNDYLKPLSLYYKNKYNIAYSNLKIVNVADTVVPARDITFFIIDYDSNRIVQDIEQKLILFNKQPSIITLTKDSYVNIII